MIQGYSEFPAHLLAKLLEDIHSWTMGDDLAAHDASSDFNEEDITK